MVAAAQVAATVAAVVAAAQVAATVAAVVAAAQVAATVAAVVAAAQVAAAQVIMMELQGRERRSCRWQWLLWRISGSRAGDVSSQNGIVNDVESALDSDGMEAVDADDVASALAEFN